jgi:catechol 2,3-dioxygenase-like lactoylglutathione lyase family enzyme
VNTRAFTVRQIDHIALNVQDVARSVAWYVDVLGLERRHQDVWGDRPAFLFAGSTGIALFPAAGKADPAPGHPLTGMHHFAFQVDRANFERAQQDLTSRGIAFEFRDHQISHSIYFRDPDGYALEITTYEL